MRHLGSPGHIFEQYFAWHCLILHRFLSAGPGNWQGQHRHNKQRISMQKFALKKASRNTRVFSAKEFEASDIELFLFSLAFFKTNCIYRFLLRPDWHLPKAFNCPGLHLVPLMLNTVRGTIWSLHSR